MKRCFRILLCISPEFNKTTQTKLVPALTALHNFRRLNDNTDEEDWDPDDEDGSDAPDLFAMPLAESFYEFGDSVGPTADDLSLGITEEETTQADARRDEIAAQMWASYQAYLADV